MPHIYKDKEARRKYLRDYQNKWMAARRSRFIEKLGGKCIECGSSEKLEFHHRNKEEKSSHRIWSWKVDRIEVELAKCDLLCAQCHWSHTCEERDYKNNIHGTEATYARGCRCPDCRKANANRKARWRKRTGRH